MWIALRPSEIECNKYERYMHEAAVHKEEMVQSGFLITIFSHDMINSNSFIDTIDGIFSGHLDIKMSVSKAPLPLNASPGNTPIVIPIRTKFSKTDKFKIVKREK